MRLTIGVTALVLRVAPRGAGYVAHAEREDGGDPFGIECSAATEADAVARLTAWLEWQSEHSVALEALQQAERAYHRAIAGNAFGSPSDGSDTGPKESLRAVEAARVKLDRIRQQRHLLFEMLKSL
jgi:hypothetical protein